MTTLQEYIGTLVASITEARLMSDKLTSRVASEYAKDPILMHFSVPRMRIEDVEMDISVALDDIGEQTTTKVEPIDDVKFNSLVYKEVVASLGRKSLPLAASQTLRKIISERTQNLEQNIRMRNEIDIPLEDYTRQIAAEALALNLSPTTKGEATPSDEVMISRLTRALTPEIKLTEAKVKVLNVTAETAKLSEQKGDNFIRVKFKISETGYEWTKVEEKGKEVVRLLPE